MRNLVSLDALEALDAIDRKGSFAAAAASLYKVPSALSYTIQKLEQDLDVILFDKSGRRAVLTPAGQSLLEQGRELLLAAERLVENTRRLDRGWESNVNIAIDSILASDFIYPIIADLHQIQADIDIRLFQEVFSGGWDALSSGRADIAIGVPEHSAKQSSEFNTVEIGQAQWVFAVAAHHPLSKQKKALSEDQIRQYPAIIVRDSSRNLPAMSSRLLEQQTRIVVSTIDDKIQAQLAGVGVGYLPKARIESLLNQGQLLSLKTQQTAEPEPLYLAWRNKKNARAMDHITQALIKHFIS